MNRMKIFVTFAQTWKLDNGNTGLTLNYFLFGDHGELMESYCDYTGGPVGQQRAKCSLDAAKRSKITFVPGIYDAEMGLKVGSDGKPVLTVTDLDFLCKAEVLALPVEE